MTDNACHVRRFCSSDETNVKRLLREAAFSNIWPGIVSSISHRIFIFLVLFISLITYSWAESIAHSVAFVGISLVCISLVHTIAAVYYVYGPPLADLNCISNVYQSNADTEFWVAEVQRSNETAEIAGTAAIVRKSNHEPGIAYLRRMAVRKKYRKQGVASKLLVVAVDFCRLHGYSHVELITTDVHHAAMKLYIKFGFQCISYRPRKYLGGLVSIWTYVFDYHINKSL